MKQTNKIKKFSLRRKLTIAVHCSLLVVTCLFFAGCAKKAAPSQPAPIPSQPTLHLASFAPDTLNPFQTQNAAAKQILNLVYEPLIWCDASMNPVPILAQSWTSSNNCTVWDVSLRPNVQFQDGSALTPSDVINSLNQAKSSATYSYIFKDIKEFHSSGNDIIFTLNQAVPNFISLLEIPIIKGDNLGTGCYKITDTTTNKYMELTAFDGWWNPDKPNITDINIQFMPDQNTFFFAFNAGEVDMATANNDDLSQYTFSANAATVSLPTTKFNFMGFNGTRTSLFTTEMKQAINSALDKAQLSSTVFSGKVTTANTFINPLFSMASQEYNGGIFSLQNAQNILSNYNGKKSFELLVNQENTNRVNVAQFIADSLKPLGINVTVKKVAYADYINAIKTYNYDAFIGEIQLPNNSAPTILFENNNMFAYSSDNMNQELANWQQQTTDAGLQGGYHYTSAQYLTDLPFISLYFETNTVLYSEKLTSTKGKFAPYPDNPFADINYWKFK